jgi:hypothetical protein
VGSLSVFSRLLNLLDHVLAGGKIDEGGGAQLLQAHLLFLVTRVDSDDPQTHGFGVLLSKGSKSATSTNDRNRLSWAGTRLLQTLVNCDTSAQYRRNCIERNVFVKAGNVSGLGNAVLLEGAVDSVARKKSFGAKRLIWISRQPNYTLSLIMGLSGFETDDDVSLPLGNL